MLFKRLRMEQGWKDNMLPGTEVMMTSKSNMTTKVFFACLEHFAKLKTEKPTLLVCDGTSFHFFSEIVTRVDEHNITQYYLLSNMTHNL